MVIRAEKSDRTRLAASVTRALNERGHDQSIASLRIGNAATPRALPYEAVHVERKLVVIGGCRAHDVPTIGRCMARA